MMAIFVPLIVIITWLTNMLRSRCHLFSQLHRSTYFTRYFSITNQLKQSSIDTLRKIEQEKRFADIEDQVQKIFSEENKNYIEEAIEILKRVNSKYSLSKFPLFMVCFEYACRFQLHDRDIGDLLKFFNNSEILIRL